MYRHRTNYWSLSKFSKWIRTKAGLENPFTLPSEGWDKHHEDSKQKAPVINWITEEWFDKVQNVVMFIPDCYYAFRTASIWKFFRTVYVFRKALWNYRSWDFSGLLIFMETAARDMSTCHELHGHLIKSEESAKELKVWAELLKRVREDDFHGDKVDFVETGRKGIFGGWEHVQKPNTLPNYKHGRTFYKIEKSVQKHNLHLAAKMFERKLRSWWD